MFCSACGTKSNDESAQFCRSCGAAFHAGTTISSPAPAIIKDTLPDGIKGWSWGAFLLNWIWAIGNRTWIGLLALIPYVGFGVAIWLGIKGREMAWANGQWQSVEHFNRVQKKWSQWAVGILLASCVIAVLGGIGASIYMSRNPSAVDDKITEGMAAYLDHVNDGKPGGIVMKEEWKAPAEIHRLDSNTDALPTPLKTVAGMLSKVEMQNGQNGIALNDQLLFSGDDAHWQKPVQVFKLPEQREYILMASSGGRGNSCETLFYFLIADRSGMRATPEFGTCSPEGTYAQEAGKITLTLPMMGGHSTIVFDGATVTEDGKVVELTEGNDPSK